MWLDTEGHLQLLYVTTTAVVPKGRGQVGLLIQISHVQAGHRIRIEGIALQNGVPVDIHNCEARIHWRSPGVESKRSRTM